ncbi:Tudor domain-containing protein 7 [Gryganskiella cystojenkinii]|nr:Tudor domain-containing protein 7 [Gryganskiella cystojenkinii]
MATAPEQGSEIEPDDHIRRITMALTQYTTRGFPGGKGLPEELLRQGTEQLLAPSSEIMELYATLLRDNLDLNPKMREVLTDQSFAASSLGLSHDFHLHHHHSPPRSCEDCGADHGHEDRLDFPDDSYEDEPDEEESEGEEEYGDDDTHDHNHDHDGSHHLHHHHHHHDDYVEDSLDDEDYEDDDEQDVVDGYSHHYEENNVKMMAYEEEKLKLETVRRVREEERRLKEEFRKKRMSERLRQKQEKERILLLQRLRLEDEERRRREALEQQRKEKLEEEMRKKREAAVADQTARSFLFQRTQRSEAKLVKEMIESSPENSSSLAGVPKFCTQAATRLVGWEFMTIVEGVGEVSEERGIQETLLHVAVRIGCVELAVFFVEKGAPLDALDSNGLTPLHTAAKHSSPFEICKLLVEKTVHHIDKSCIISGKTAMHYAAQSGNADLVALLLAHHARINPLDVKGNTPEALAKSGLDSVLSEKPTKNNSKQSNTAKAQKFRNTLGHLQKALAAIKEAQSRKDAQLEEQRRKDEALARAEAEKDNAARRKQEEKLEADLRRRLEEEKELERLKAMASDPNGNNNSSSKNKKKKKKGKGGNEGPVSNSRDTPQPAHATISSAATSSTTVVSSSSTTTPQMSATTPQSSVPATVQSAVTSKPLSTPALVSTPAPVVVATPPKLVVRIPKPKTSYRPSHLVVTRMTDMGFPLRDSRKALIQTEGRVEDAIDLLTSGAQLADDSEDEAELAAEKAKAKQAAAALAARALQAKSQEANTNTNANGFSPATRPAANGGFVPGSQQAQQPAQLQHQAPPQIRTGQAPPGIHPASVRPVNHPVQILHRTHAMAPHVQPRSVPTQVLQRPQPHTPATPLTVNPTLRKSLSNQGVPSMSSPPTQPATTIASFIAPRTVQPTPPTRAPYSYGPTSSATQPKPLLSPSASTPGSGFKIPLSGSTSSLDRTVGDRRPSAEYGLGGITRKFGSMDLTGAQQSSSLSPGGFGSGSFSGFPTSTPTWDTNLTNLNMNATSMELPSPISAGFQPPSMTGHSLWGTPGLSLPGAPLLQTVGDNANPNATFGSPFLTSLPASHHQQHHNPAQQQQQQQQQQPLSRPSGVGFGASDTLDLGDEDEDVLAMTMARDTEEFAKYEAEYSSLANGGASQGATPPSRAVGGGRGSTSHPPLNTLWGASSGGSGQNGGEGNFGLPSPIGTVNGHGLLSGRVKSLDSRLDNSGSLDLQGGGSVSEYSQWNSGFALDQTMYPGQQRQQQPQQQQQHHQSGVNSFMDSFFGSGVGMNGGRAPSSSASSSPYGLHQNHLQTYSPQHQSQQLHHQQQRQQQQQQQQMHPHAPLGQFEYSNFGVLGNLNSGVGNGLGPSSPSLSSVASDLTGTSPSATMRSVGAIGSSRVGYGSESLVGSSSTGSGASHDSHSSPKQY